MAKRKLNESERNEVGYLRKKFKNNVISFQEFHNKLVAIYDKNS